MKMTFYGKEIELRYSFRALMIYEQIAKKSFDPKNLSDIIVFFYSIVITSEHIDDLSFNSFVDEIDKRPQLVTDFSAWLVKIYKQQSTILNKEEEKSTKKPKKV